MVKLWVVSLESALGRGFGVEITEIAFAFRVGRAKKWLCSEFQECAIAKVDFTGL